MSPKLRRTYAPPLRRDWSDISITLAQATQLLNAARWPNGKPPGLPDDDVVKGLSTIKVSIYELGSAMMLAHMHRRGPLPKRSKRQLRDKLRKMLSVKRLSDEALLDLWHRLDIY